MATRIIRQCSISEVPAIFELNCVQMGYEYSIDETSNNIKRILKNEQNKIYVACLDEKVIGYIHGGVYELIYAPRMVNVMGIAVMEQYQHNGVGRELLLKLETWAKENHAFCVRLHSGENRLEAHSFYLKCGYKMSGVQKKFVKEL